MYQLAEQDYAHVTQFNSVQNEVEKSRALQEVQGAIVMARKFPRDEVIVLKQLKNAAKSLKLAEQAIYAYPRGGSMITGPSIRAAETLAQYWGNLLSGTKILSQNAADHTSEVMAYCWDLETNVRNERTFKSSHIRETKSGNKILTSSRDIYEKEANDASRRLRSCILATIPKHITEEFMSFCENTLIGSTGKTLQERIEDLLNKFAEIGITKEIIEKKMGVTTDKFVAKNIVMLGYIYNTIKDNIAPASMFFDIPTPVQKQLNSALKKNKENVKVNSEPTEPQQETFINISEYGEVEENYEM